MRSADDDSDEGKQLRAEIVKLRSDNHRRYQPALQERILSWVGRATASGLARSQCGRLLRIMTWRLTSWQRAQDQRAVEAAPLALVPIETPAFETAGVGLTMTAPSGHRIDGLTLPQVLTLLRELA